MNAAVIPGKSGAGIELGRHIKEFSEIGVGDRLDKVSNHAVLQYDDVDEFHHASIKQEEIGLSFYAEETSLAAPPDQTISRMFVHNGFL